MLFLACACTCLVVAGCSGATEGSALHRDEGAIGSPALETVGPTLEGPTSAAPEVHGSVPRAPDDLKTIGGWDAAPVLHDPPLWSAGEADRRYGPDAQVVGIALDGVARAYPLTLLSRFPIVNDTIAGVPMVVTWSSAAHAATAHARPTVDGLALDFGFSGKLIRGALVLYDRQSESLWNPLRAEAIWGALARWQLERVPAVQTTWSAWLSAHPDTQALAEQDAALTQDAVGGPALPSDPAAPALPDDRLEAVTLVIGIVLDDVAVAWPRESLSQRPVLNEYVGENAVLLVYDSEAATAMPFDRVVGGRALAFRSQASDEGLLLRDDETGSTWDGWSGEAVGGSLSGDALELLPSVTAFWSAWHDQYPDTELR